MIPTISFIQQKFHEYNVQMFGGKLCVPPIKLTRARTFVGQCAGKRLRTPTGVRLTGLHLKFSVSFDLPEREWEDTIIHEMIHYYIGVNGLRDTSAHGRLFRSIMEDVNRRFGRAVSISHRSTPEQREALCNERRVWHVIAVVQLADGRKGLKVLPRIRQRIDTYRKMLLRDPKFTRIDLYMSNDTYFNRFPNSSALRVELPPESEFMPHIQQAEPLVLN